MDGALLVLMGLSIGTALGITIAIVLIALFRRR